MVLSRQTGTEEKLGISSLRHHAMPSPLYTLLTLLLATIFSFSFPISLFLPLMALLISISCLLRSISFSPLTPFCPLCPSLTPPFSSYPHLFVYSNMSCSVLSHCKGKAALPPSTSHSLLFILWGATEPCPPITLGHRVRIQP